MNDMADYRTLLVPYDFSVHAKAALDAAVDLAGKLGANLKVLHIVQSPLAVYGLPYPEGSTMVPPIDMVEIREACLKSLREVVAEVQAQIEGPGKIEAEVVEGMNIAETLRATAEKLNADLIVMGTHGRTGVAHVFLGSVAERILRTATCPVLTVKTQE
jgi:universal stress protein A